MGERRSLGIQVPGRLGDVLRDVGVDIPTKLVLNTHIMLYETSVKKIICILIYNIRSFYLSRFLKGCGIGEEYNVNKGKGN